MAESLKTPKEFKSVSVPIEGYDIVLDEAARKTEEIGATISMGDMVTIMAKEYRERRLKK